VPVASDGCWLGTFQKLNEMTGWYIKVCQALTGTGGACRGYLAGTRGQLELEA
jgi:hypothetical protein